MSLYLTPLNTAMRSTGPNRTHMSNAVYRAALLSLLQRDALIEAETLVPAGGTMHPAQRDAIKRFAHSRMDAAVNLVCSREGADHV